MTTTTGTLRGQDLYITDRPERCDLVAPVLMRHLGLSMDEAISRLGTPQSLLASNLSLAEANMLRAVLATLGARTRLQSETKAPQLDISIQLAVWADVPVVTSKLAAKIGRTVAETADGLGKPGGLILCGLDPVATQSLAKSLRPIRGLILATSDPETTVYDLYRQRPLTLPEEAQLSSSRTLVGAQPDPLTEAVAAGLDRRLRDVLLARLPDLDLLPLDRRFQRFDLVLTGASGWSRTELADFLTSRTNLPRAAVEALSPSAPVTLDLGLTWSVARRFCGDYGAIGLLVRPVLGTRSRNA